MKAKELYNKHYKLKERARGDGKMDESIIQ